MARKQLGFEDKPARHLEQKLVRTRLAGVGGQAQSEVGTRLGDELLEGDERLAANPCCRLVGKACGFDQDQRLALLNGQARECPQHVAVKLPSETGQRRLWADRRLAASEFSVEIGPQPAD